MTDPYGDWLINGLVVAATLGAVGLCVLLHYEGLLAVSGRLARRHTAPRFKVVLGIVAVITLHVAEIWLFGLAAWGLLQVGGTGAIAGLTHPPLLDIVYLSSTTFTTVGYGDLSPQGPIRFLFGTEALTGFVMITWSASFTYLEMERFWRRP